MNNIDHARMFGFTASLWRGDRAELLIKGLFGEVITEATYQEAVEHNLVVPIKAMMVPCHTRETQVTDSMMLDKRFNYILNSGRNQLIANLARDIPEDEQVLIMVGTFEHAVRLHQLLPEFTVCHGGAGTKVKRNRPWTDETAPETLKAIHKTKGSVHRFVKIQTALGTAVYAEAELAGDPVKYSFPADSEVLEDGTLCYRENNRVYIRLTAACEVSPFVVTDKTVSFAKLFADYIRVDGSPCGSPQMVDRNIGGVDMTQYKMTPKIIADIRKRFEDGSLKKLIATNIFSEGVNFVGLKYLIRADGEVSKISNTQIPGRLSRLMPGKSCSYLIDFIDHFSPWAYRRSVVRYNDYKQAGWVQGPCPPYEKRIDN